MSLPGRAACRYPCATDTPNWLAHDHPVTSFDGDVLHVAVGDRYAVVKLDDNLIAVAPFTPSEDNSPRAH